MKEGVGRQNRHRIVGSFGEGALNGNVVGQLTYANNITE